MSETPLASGAMPQSDFESQYRRIFEATGCHTQVELAELLGIRQSSISDAKRRRTIPAEWLLKIFDKKGISPDWIRTGVGNEKATPSTAAGQTLPAATRIERRPAKDCSTDELLGEVIRRALKVMG